MKKLMQIGLLSAGLAGFGLAGWAADQKIATFNLRKAFDSYYKTIQSTVAIKQEVAEAKKEEAQMVESARKHEEELHQLIDKANDQAVSAEQREKSKKAATDKSAEFDIDKQSINEFRQRADMHLRAKQEQRTADIVKEIQGVVEAHAKAAGYSMVLDSSGESGNHVTVLLYSNGQDDLTDSIIKELNAAAPPGSLDTNAPAAPASTNLINTISPSK
jgi:Skp family chaperone for outer membrane proteins